MTYQYNGKNKKVILPYTQSNKADPEQTLQTVESDQGLNSLLCIQPESSCSKRR